MLLRKITLILLSISLPFVSICQEYSLTGNIQDEANNSGLIGVTVVVIPLNDTSQKTGTITDIDGNFVFEQNIKPGRYTLKASYIGFANYKQIITVNNNTNLGILKMKVLSAKLSGVTITEKQLIAQQSSDTTNYNAGAFKTNPDANAEDLVNKMPGITTEGGTLKANGENVQQVLVDGKPFFGDDPNAAIKNLPAEIIDRIQIFDKLSDQAQLTGFDDGNSQKTLNIITKPGKNNGQFGKLNGGYGFQDGQSNNQLYIGGGNLNYFKGDTRVSIIALTNNINQQNFSSDDLLGVVGTSSGHSRGRSGGSGRGGGSDASSFLINQQSGITKTNSVGINYSDNWGKKIKVTGSYFFNNTDNVNTTSLARTYLTGADSNLFYKENSTTNAKNTNHRANLRLEYEIDPNNSIILSPKISIQNNDNSSNLSGNTKAADSSLINSTSNNNTTKNNGYNLTGNFVYRHKFNKRGRTFSINLNSQTSTHNGNGTTYSNSIYNNVDSTGTPYTTTSILDQRYDLNSVTQTYSANATYTEPLTDLSQLMVNYAPSFSNSNSDKETYNKVGVNYTDRDTFLSNKYTNQYNTHRGGLSYRYNNKKTMLMARLNYQYAMLDGDQQYPSTFSIKRNFSSVLPQVMFNYRFSRTKNLHIMYRTGTDAPSVSQLQNVFDISNSLLIKTGNQDLKQSYQHTLIFRYGNTNPKTSTNFFALIYANYAQNYIGNETLYPTQNILITEDSSVMLNKGSQVTRPINLNGYFSGRSFLTYGLPIRKIKSNLNLTAGINYNRLPGLIKNINTYNDIFSTAGGTTNISNNYTFNGGVVLSSNISENVDFTISYSGYYNVVKNSIQTLSDNNYYNHIISVKFNWIFLNRFVFNTNVNEQLYSGLAQGYNQSYFLWNAALGYKFLKDKSLDLRISANDILNQNRSITRTVTDTYIEDSYTNVLRRYFMLNLTYTLRRFKDAQPDNNMEPPPDRGFDGGGRHWGNHPPNEQ